MMWFVLRIRHFSINIYRADPDVPGYRLVSNKYGDQLIGYGLLLGTVAISVKWKKVRR